ncbi:YjgN family protein [Marinobacter zhejiangensis]|uniref:DUF898 domain-containing protein n=1 Tax=Marinobacter zhejiangensis TaxID=488535 RepID=A0A1I4NU59_9GAMM|nr:DUF898 family protein [Marinobacter zhejiangensis]SFM19041.1 protein of unknown function [Marinobacter zhejiangensis]
MTTDTPEASVAQPAQSIPVPEHFPRNEPVKFSGQAGEFFGIWFVNNILTWMTLGIYSAWAKVRTLQYFYGNTEVAGGSFNFTASPLKILRSRIIAFALLVLFIVADNSPADWALYVYVGFVVVYLALAPVLTVLVMSFQLRYSAWRGINFRFNQDYRGAYRVYLPPFTVLLLLAGSLMLPVYSEEVEQFFGQDTMASEQAEEQPEEQPAPQAEPTDDPLAPPASDSSAMPSGKSSEPTSAKLSATGGPQAPTTGTEERSKSKVLGGPQKQGTNGAPDKEVVLADGGKESLSLEEELEEVNPYLFIPALVLLLVFLGLLPYFDFISQRFLARNVRFGTAEVSYTGEAKDYYVIYWRWMLATALLVTLWVWFAASDFDIGGLLVPLIIATVLYMPLSRAYLKSRRYNLLFGKCSIDQGKFHLNANVPFLKLAYVLITNTLMVTITFGLMTAWAQVRTARTILESMSLDVNAPLNQFVAAQDKEQSAFAEEVADVFDIDVAF